MQLDLWGHSSGLSAGVKHWAQLLAREADLGIGYTTSRA